MDLSSPIEHSENGSLPVDSDYGREMGRDISSHNARQLPSVRITCERVTQTPTSCSTFPIGARNGVENRVAGSRQLPYEF